MADPWMAERLRFAAQAAAAERAVYNDYWARLTSWLVEVIRAVLQPGRVDPYGVYAVAPEWARHAQEHVYGPVRDAAAAAWRDVTGTDWDYEQPPKVAAYLATVHNRMVRTPDEVFDVIASEVAGGAADGESIPEIADRIRSTLDTTGTENWPGRATTVARTETLGALNSARDEAFEEIAIDLGGEFERMWLATIDDRTRPTHRAADRQRRPMGQPFDVGGFSLSRPGDPFGPPQEIINCRCTELLLRRNESVDLSNRQYRGD